MELMIGVVLAGVLMVIAIPGFNRLQQNNCMTVHANTLVTSLQLARSIAITKNAEVTLTASNTDANNEWGAGWRITLNEDRNGNGSLDAREDYNGDGALDTTATVRDVTLTGCLLTTIDEVSSPAPVTRRIFSYAPNGFIDEPGVFNICDDRTGEIGRQLTVNPVGRPSINSRFTCT